MDGYGTEFVREEPGHTFIERSLPPLPPTAELPLGRAMLTDGWLRVTRRPDPPKP